MGGAQAAEDVTQTVFVALARQAPQLTRHPALSGWLHCTTRNVAAKTVRSDVRRRVREEEAAVMNELLANDSTAIGEHIAPHLDAALGELNAAERDAVLLRFFEKKSAQEMAQILGVSHEAAQKRVNRGVERLREIFAKHGVSVGVGGLATIISINAVQAAPAGLAATIAAASILSAGSGTFTLMNIMTMTKIKLGISALVVAGVTTALVVQHQTQTKLHAENGSLQQQIAQLQTDNESFSNRLATAGDAKKLSDGQFNELLKLRGEVTQLRNSAYALTQPRNTPAGLETKQADSAFLIQGRTVADWVSEFQIGGFPGGTNLANTVLDSAGPPILPQLASLLKGESFDQQAKAAAAISEICYYNPDTPTASAVVPALAVSAKSKNSEVQIYSIQALGAIGKAASSATPDLIQLTRDPNASVRMCAVETLGRIGADSPESVAALKAALSDASSDVRVTAKESLGKVQSSYK